MTYQQAIDYLYSRLPIFQNQGARAYKPGLTTTREFCHYLGDPQLSFPSVHIGGTNGKGSTSHMLASILQNAGFKVGLYTSPHLKSFTERIRVNGQLVDEDFVIRFVETHREYIEHIQPSFFEVTVAMAFTYFAEKQVDIAVVEVGMGGRLDSTNILVPLVSVITNISFDHMQYLGNTLPKIASEKAGIIKTRVPVVISEKADEEVIQVFRSKAEEVSAPLYLADELVQIYSEETTDHSLRLTGRIGVEEQLSDFSLELDLTGQYQQRNLKGVLVALMLLRNQGIQMSNSSIYEGLRTVRKTTGLKGRWQTLQWKPRVICDTAHNEAGLKFALEQLLKMDATHLRFVIGFVSDKDLETILALFPTQATYYFCQPANPRAKPAGELQAKAAEWGLRGDQFPDVNLALEKALKDSEETDLIYVGGSTFVVADLNYL